MSDESHAIFQVSDFADIFTNPMQPYLDEALKRMAERDYRNAGALAYEVAQFFFEPEDEQFGKVRRKLETRLGPYFST